MKYGIVVTTIFDGAFLDAYFDHFQKTGTLDQVAFYVVGDLSTPPECAQRVAKYRAMGLPWFYLGREEQEQFLKPFPALAAEIPWKSDNRRNVGFLKAYADRVETIIAIDDDNFPVDSCDFLLGHANVGRTLSLPSAKGHAGWFNLCSMMEATLPSIASEGTVYARGFPYKRRTPLCGQIAAQNEEGLVAINAGLWSGDPDVDAATRLVTRCATRAKTDQSYLLAKDTIMPINTQNTAILRAALPAYYYVKMGHKISGMNLDRFGDIFSGFFVQKCAQALGHRVRVGTPIVDHRRSPHNLYKDLWNELAGMVIIDDMLPVLETSLPSCASYEEACQNLASVLESWAAGQKGFLWDQGLVDYFKNVSANMRLWTDVCRQLR